LPRLWRGKPTQTQRTRSLDRIYRMSRIGCKDRWKSRYAGIPRLSLGNNGKPWSTKISSLIFVPHGFPFFQAIQPTHFVENPCNPCVLRSRTHVIETFWQGTYSCEGGAFKRFLRVIPDNICVICIICGPRICVQEILGS